MPEVVEVCLTALYLNHKFKNRMLTDIVVHGGRYKRHTLKGLTEFKNNKPFRIVKIDSKGKFMWFELVDLNNRSYFIFNTYGLEGQWGLTKSKHSNIEFKIYHNKKSKSLYFTDSRNFGTLEIINDKKVLNRKLESLAPDFLKSTFTDKEFYERIRSFIFKNNGSTINKSKAKKEIIKVLMDQKTKSSIGSGLGNYLAVESLYDAGISPYRSMIELYNNRALCNKLAKSIRYITKLSFMTADIGYLGDLDVKMSVYVTNMRKDIAKDKNHIYNFHPKCKLKSKDKFKFKVYRQKVDPDGNKIVGDKIIDGRTTYWSPIKQTS